MSACSHSTRIPARGAVVVASRVAILYGPVALFAQSASPASAPDPRQQTAVAPPANQPPATTAASRSTFQVRGFADVGYTTFSASDTFRAIFGEPGGLIFGGGVQVVHRTGWMFQLNASRF